MDIKDYVFKKIKELTSQKFGEKSKVKEIGIDSLDLVEVIVEFEKKFKISIPDDELEKIKTIKDVIDLINKYIK